MSSRLVLLFCLVGLGLSLAQDFNATNSTIFSAPFNSSTAIDEETITTTTTKLPVQLSTSAATTSSAALATTTAPSANIFQLKTICSCLMDKMEESEMITCPTNFKINIVSAILYDMSNMSCEKSDTTIQAGYLSSIKEDLANYCTGTNCSISKSYIIGSVDVTHRAKEVICLTADIKWFCYQFTTTYSIVSSSNSAYGFTYFFYIITLILSSSCILIGAIFILRRFLMIRRTANQTRSRRAAQRAYSAHLAHMNYHNGGMNTGNTNIWTCTYAPPAYDHIYESSHPINPPPDYDATMANNMKFHYLKAEDQVVIVYPNQDEPQQQQTSNQNQSVVENQSELFTLQPLYITTDPPAEASNNQVQAEPAQQGEETAAEPSSGQLNLAFKPENLQQPPTGTASDSTSAGAVVKPESEASQPKS